MSSNTHFSPLNTVEKRSKLRQLANAKGQLTLWRKGEKNRRQFRVNEFNRDKDLMLVHAEPDSPRNNEILFANFELNGVPYFLKVQVVRTETTQFEVKCLDECFKSERRQNFRLLTFPIYEVAGYFNIPAQYEEGKVLDISRKPNQTGLFKSFLKLVDANPSSKSMVGDRLKLRLQDISVTGMSVFIGPAELEWFKTGEELKDTEIHFPDEVLRMPKIKIVYVVDHIGPNNRNQKQFKVGLRFEEMPPSLDANLATKINTLLRQVDANKDFEDFLK